MKTVNLRDYFHWYATDVYIEVTDAVAVELRAEKTCEVTHWRRMKRNHSNFSLDAGDGIEHCVSRAEPDPEALILLQERLTLLDRALNALSEKQGRRVDAHILLRKRLKEIAKAEGVCAETVGKSVRDGLKNMKTYLLEHGF